MPRFFFDVFDGKVRTDDTTGIELHSNADIEREAILALPDLVRDELPTGSGTKSFSVHVRSADGQPVFRATFEFVAEWLDDRTRT